jgi:ankyrin repeat protein
MHELMTSATSARRGLAAILCVVGVGTALSAAPAVSSLVEAARRGDLAAVRTLLQRNVDANSRSIDGTTALLWAAEHGDLDMVTLLLQRRAQPNAENRYGATPLRAASVQGSLAIVEALLNAGADADAVRAESGDTPLMLAARAGHADIVRVLIARGARADRVEPVRKQTALMWAAAERHADVVALLLASGANPRLASSTGISPLMFAVRAGDLESTRLLVDAGVDVNAPAKDGTYPLQFAILNTRLEIAKYLLERGAQPKADTHGTPLQLLTFMRKAETTALTQVIARELPQMGVDAFTLGKALLAAGDDINARYRSPVAPPHVAVGMYWIQFTGATPFFVAAMTADPQWMRFLADHGADPSMTTVANVAPIHAAAGIGLWRGIGAGSNADAFEAVKLCVELGADPARVVAGGEKPDPRWEGATPLHGAVIRNAPEIVAWLAEKGVPLDVKTKRGFTPYQFAGHNVMGELSGGGLYLVSPDAGERLLHAAKTRGQALDMTAPVLKVAGAKALGQ